MCAHRPQSESYACPSIKIRLAPELGWEMVGLEVRDGTEIKLMALGGFIEIRVGNGWTRG